MKALTTRRRGAGIAFCALLAVLLSLLFTVQAEAWTGEAAATPEPEITGTPAEAETAQEEPPAPDGKDDAPEAEAPAEAPEEDPPVEAPEEKEPAEAPEEDEPAELPEEDIPAEVPEEDDADPEEGQLPEESLRPGVPFEADLGESKSLRLTLARRTDLLLEVSGIPVKVTVTALASGFTRSWASADKGAGSLIRDELTLDRGDYCVTVEPLRADRPGHVSLCLSVRDPAAPAAAEAMTAEALPAEEEAGTAEAAGEREESAPAAEPAGETAEAPEEPAEQETVEAPETADAAAPAAVPLTVRVTMACEDGWRIGATVVLTARVSDPDYRGTVRWQYSDDGGLTVCDVEGAAGAEYRFTLTEENSDYWWRAYLE